jgi:phosphonate transport system permease protein
MNTSSSSGAVASFEAAYADMARIRRRQTLLGIALFLAAVMVSAHFGEVTIAGFIAGLPGFGNYIGDILPPLRAAHLAEDVAEWYWAFGRWLGLLWDTILIAFLGTLLGVAGATILCFPASQNLSRNRWVYFLARRITEFARGVPELVYAMVFVFAFGIGPFAGVLAIAIHTAGALGKLFSEVNENVDNQPIEGLNAAGASWVQMLRYAVVPQVLPNYASYALLRFEINVRGASVIGFVGAGGIGQELMFVIRQFVYVDISALVLMVVVCVSIIDIACEALRHRLIGKGMMA